MGGPPVPLKNASDAYVSEKYPNKNYNSVTKLFGADASASDTRYIYIYFGLPSGMAGTTVMPSKFRMWSGSGFAGSVTATVQRLTQKFSANKVNWGNKPSATTTGQVAVTKVGAASGTMWEWDITPLLQSVANGTAWYGFRIVLTGSSAKWFYSAQGPDQFRPELEVSWSDSPDAPEGLIPNNGLAVSVPKPTLQWDFVDPSGDQTMLSSRLRLFTSQANADANTSPALDITIPSGIPEFDLDDALAAAYGGLAADAQLWWRVLNTDGAGLPSQWSEVATFIRKTKGTLTITNPAAGTPAFVNDATPPFAWTFTGRTQKKYEVILTTPETPGVYIWTSGIITDTALAVTPPPDKIKELGKTYRLIVRIYDTENRQQVPDDPIYVEATRDFVYQFANTVATVTGLTGVPDTQRPNMVLTWQRSTAPDTFVILRDGKVIFEDQPVDLFVSGTTYTFTDDEASPRKDHVWEVAAKVNGVTSSGNPTVTGKVKAIAPMLSSIGGAKPVLFLNPDVAAERTESSDIHYILGNAPPVLITQSIRGYEGTVSGVLANNTLTGVTADQMLDNLEYFKDNPGTVVKFLWVNKVMRVVIRNVTDEPLAYPDGTVEYLASFEFFEVGF